MSIPVTHNDEEFQTLMQCLDIVEILEIRLRSRHAAAQRNLAAAREELLEMRQRIRKAQEDLRVTANGQGG